MSLRTLKNVDCFESYLKFKKTLKFGLFLQSFLQNLTKRVHSRLILKIILMAFTLLRVQISSLIFQIFSIFIAKNFQSARNNYHSTSIFPRFPIFFRLIIIKWNIYCYNTRCQELAFKEFPFTKFLEKLKKVCQN